MISQKSDKLVGVAAGILCALCVMAMAAGAQDGDPVAALISKAGNADDDQARLAYLEELRDLPGLDEQIRSDAERMIAAVERWMHEPKLTYFGREVLETDQYDFGIAEESPLFPLTIIYRARMMVWVTMEYGGYWNDAAIRRERLDIVRAVFEQARDAFPENRLIRMYLGEPIPARKQYASVDGAPDWAVYQREGLERLADIIEWWIEHRMQPSGEYGGGWGDDCEMWRWWVPVLIAFDEPKISQAQARFSTALMAQEHMKLGYTTHVYDVEHTAEDSADALTPMMHIEPDSEVWRGRALRLADLMEGLWTGTNERGFLQFKSTYFSVDTVDPDARKACDTVYHPRAVQPALLYWQRTGDARLSKLFTAWMDTWVDATARAERGKPAGIIPSAIHWPDGNVGGLGDNWWDPENHTKDPLYVWPSAMSQMTQTLLLTYYMTGDEKYLEPIRSMARIRLNYLENPPDEPPAPGSEAWCAAQLGRLSEVAAKCALLTGTHEFDELLARDANAYMVFRRGSGRDRLTDELKANAECLRGNFEGYTSEVRYTDRVLRLPALFGDNGMFPKAVSPLGLPNPTLLYSAATGDPGNLGYFAMNAVRWLTPPRDIAALVTDSGEDRLCAELFHFGEEPRPMAAELCLLKPGEYTFTLTPAGAEAPVERRPMTVSGPRARLTFALPPRVLCFVEIRRED